MWIACLTALERYNSTIVEGSGYSVMRWWIGSERSFSPRDSSNGSPARANYKAAWRVTASVIVIVTVIEIV